MSKRVVFAAVLVALWSWTTSAAASIPAAAKADPRFTLGYVVVTYYPGVKSDGTGDSTAGLQQAIDDAFGANLAVLFPAGTYVISDTLKCYEYYLWDSARNLPSSSAGGVSTVVGSTLGASRPVIKLASTAPAFDDSGAPRPELVFRAFVAANSSATPAEPSDPLVGVPANFVEGSDSLFDAELRGLDFDTSGHAGAIGVSFTAAQDSTMENVKVTATGSYAGVYGVPGRDMGALNVEVDGGQIGIVVAPAAGPTLVGITLIGQTKVAILHEDFVPLSLVGFRIENAVGPVITSPSDGATSMGSMSLVDGVVELTRGDVAFENPGGKNIYLRDVYVSGTSNLVKSAALPAVTGSGTWAQIAEYAYTDQSTPVDATYANGANVFRSFQIADGVVGRTAEPATSITSNASAPHDVIAWHVWGPLPQYEGQDDGTVVVTAAPYGALPDDATDDLAALQSAIDAASTHGNGRVFLPTGSYRISDTLTLHANTQLFGAGRRIARIAVHPSWMPTTGEAVLVQTDDDPAATTFLGFLTLYPRTVGGGIDSAGANVYDRFEWLLWRAGGGSATLAISFDQEWAPGATNPHDMFGITGNGGGRHYFVWTNSYDCDNASFRGLHVTGTHEPLWIYGLNSEMCKSSGGPMLEANAEIDDAQNVRLFSMKREAHSNSLIVQDSTNIGFFGSGSMLSPPPSGGGGYVQVLGSSDGVLITSLAVQAVLEGLPDGEPTLSESLTGMVPVAVAWPDGVSLYKRGVIDDAMVRIGAGPIASDAGLAAADGGASREGGSGRLDAGSSLDASSQKTVSSDGGRASSASGESAPKSGSNGCSMSPGPSGSGSGVGAFWVVAVLLSCRCRSSPRRRGLGIAPPRSTRSPGYMSCLD